MQRVNQIRLRNFEHWPQQFDHLRVVVFSARWVTRPTQIVVNLSYRDAFMFGCYTSVIGRIERRRLNISDDANQVTGALGANG